MRDRPASPSTEPASASSADPAYDAPRVQRIRDLTELAAAGLRCNDIGALWHHLDTCPRCQGLAALVELEFAALTLARAEARDE